MNKTFPTDFKQILQQINEVDPIAYSKTRNYIHGAVTYLSPYISRGVISTRQVLENIAGRSYKMYQIEQFIKELCWRDYFQTTWWHKNLFTEVKQAQEPIANYEIPKAVIQYNTGIAGIDTAIKNLYEVGYMHNHNRMYLAAIVCNMAQCHWLQPAKWLYYHLLDGDWASNACSWQWVAGANSSKKYYANQENISKYTNTPLQDSFLNASYEQLATATIPEILKDTVLFTDRTTLPQQQSLVINNSLPTFIYNYYNLDPLWQKDILGNRILLIEPEIFEQCPVSNKCIQFMLSLANNIPGIQVCIDRFSNFCQRYEISSVHYKEHPLNNHYTGQVTARDFIVPALNSYYPSFFAYWQKK
jgi:deoxyribodipyrimidine photo-lyase